ncbi:MAG TPA: hypothetical protein VMZ28_24720 [Kofleriaceae bacterium]|nr:hypothetical protein [Kofleriaceae bacterium]
MRGLVVALLLLTALVGPVAHAGSGKKAPRGVMGRLRRTGGRTGGGRAKGLLEAGLGRRGAGHAGAPARPTTLGGTRRPGALRGAGTAKVRATLRVPKLARRAPRAPKRALQIRKVANRPHVAEASVSGLTVAGVGTVVKSSAQTAPRLSALGGVAGAALIVASVAGLASAETGLDRADAAHGLAWGMQSMGEVVRGSSTVTAALGVGGGAIQTAVGLHRVRSGIVQKDRRQVILGSLDVVAGAAWIASATTGNPITAGVFLVATAARVGYANAAELKALPGQIAGLARRVAARVRGGGGGRSPGEPAAATP